MPNKGTHRGIAFQHLSFPSVKTMALFLGILALHVAHTCCHKFILFPEHCGNHGHCVCRKDDPEAKELFDFVEKMRAEFESIERPILEIETPKETLTPSEERSQKGPSDDTTQSNSPKSKGVESPKSTSNSKSKGVESPKSPQAAAERMDPESELAKLELEFGKVSKDYSTDEIGGWEFDELEQELRSGISESKK